MVEGSWFGGLFLGTWTVYRVNKVRKMISQACHGILQWTRYRFSCVIRCWSSNPETLSDCCCTIVVPPLPRGLVLMVWVSVPSRKKSLRTQPVNKIVTMTGMWPKVIPQTPTWCSYTLVFMSWTCSFCCLRHFHSQAIFLEHHIPQCSLVYPHNEQEVFCPTSFSFFPFPSLCFISLEVWCYC